MRNDLKLWMIAAALVASGNVWAAADEANQDVGPRCVATLRNLFDAAKKDVTASGEALPVGRKEGVAHIAELKADTRRQQLSILGDLSIRREYYETFAIKHGDSLVLAYRLKKKSPLRDDLIEVVSDLRKLLKIEDERHDSAAAYGSVLKDFLDDVENHSPAWFDKKLAKYDSLLTTKDITLFDFIDVLVADYAREHRLFVADVEGGPKTVMAVILSKFGISESTRQFWRKKVINRYANSLVDQTIALPIKIPEILITGLVTAIVVSNFNKEQTQEQIQVATTQQAERTINSQKEELQKLIESLQSQNELFDQRVEVADVEVALPNRPVLSWSEYREKYLDIGKTFAKFSASGERLAMDPTTKLVLDAFIKQITEENRSSQESGDGVVPADESTEARVAKKIAHSLLIVPLITGETLSKDQMKEEMAYVKDYAAFNRAFLVKAKALTQLLQGALDSIVIIAGK